MTLNSKHLLPIIFSLFVLLFIVKANLIMLNTPFYDFDEAHRAENAKRMKEYKSFIVPLSGSVFDRDFSLRIPFKEDPNFFLYYHLERPTFIYVLMMFSTSLFGSVEWAYRLPSFLLGISTMAVLVFFATKIVKKVNIYALLISLLTLATSSDLWLSSEYAQLDTGLTLFLFLSIVLLIYYCQKKALTLIILSGFSFSLAVLSKGQPAFIVVFPIAYLLLSKKLSFKSLLSFVLSASILLVPWVSLLTLQFGLINVVKIFAGFAISSAIVEYSQHHAPFFWYARWWWESLRPGWTLFLALVALDLLKRKIDWPRITLLVYIFGGLIFYSVAINKIWWYVLPLIPAIALYNFMSLGEFLKRENNLLKISIVLLISSLPIFLGQTNTVGMIYGLLVTAASIFVILNKNLSTVQLLNMDFLNLKLIILIIFILSLGFFYFRFPQIIPYHRTAKALSFYYKALPGKKCLWFKDMPPEAILFYSEAGEVNPLTENIKMYGHCQNFLITPTDIKDDPMAYRDEVDKTKNLREAKVIFQLKTLQLIKL